MPLSEFDSPRRTSRHDRDAAPRAQLADDLRRLSVRLGSGSAAAGSDDGTQPFADADLALLRRHLAARRRTRPGRGRLLL